MILAQRLSVKALLESTFRGMIILKELEKNDKIDTCNISSLFIEYEFDFTKKFRYIRNTIHCIKIQTQYFITL